MALPAGITTCQVSAGVVFDFGGGSDYSTEIVATPLINLTWAATGAHILGPNAPISHMSEPGVQAVIDLPHVDQTGFLHNGAPYTMWAYRIIIVWRKGNQVVDTRTFNALQPVVGQTMIDLDTIADQPPALPVQGVVPYVTSVNDQMGAVTGVVMAGDLTLNVRDYGAVGDGVTDDTAAIKAALAAAAGRELYIPAGTYLFSETLPIAGTVRGDGASTILQAVDYETFIQADVKHCMILIQSAASIEGLRIIGSSPALAQQYPTVLTGRDERGIVVTDGAYGVSITDVTLESIGGIAVCVWSNGAGDIHLTNVSATNCGIGFESEKWTAAPAGQISNVTLTGCNMSGGVGLHTSGIRGLTATNCAFTSSANQQGNTVAISDALGVTDATFINCDFVSTALENYGGRAMACYGYRRTMPGGGATDYATPGFRARFEGCRFDNGIPNAEIKIVSCDLVELIGCTMTYQTIASIQAGTTNTRRLLVEGCTLRSINETNTDTMYGLHTEVPTVVSGCVFKGSTATFRGVSATGAVSNLTVSDCIFGSAYLGVNVGSAARLTITNNSGTGIIHNSTVENSHRLVAYGNEGTYNNLQRTLSVTDASAVASFAGYPSGTLAVNTTSNRLMVKIGTTLYTITPDV